MIKSPFCFLLGDDREKVERMFADLLNKQVQEIRGLRDSQHQIQRLLGVCQQEPVMKSVKDALLSQHHTNEAIKQVLRDHAVSEEVEQEVEYVLDMNSSSPCSEAELTFKVGESLHPPNSLTWEKRNPEIYELTR
jgi:(2Fe-2S) ferredoxin